MNIPKLAIKNYQFVIAAFVMLAAWALINFTTVPRTEFPIVDSPMVTVHAILMGSNVENMEVHVLTPLEAGLQALGDIKDLRSKISGHVISINIAFNYGVDIDEKLNKTQGLLSGMRRTLPKELIELSAHKASTNFAAVLQLALLPKSISYAQLEKEAKKIQKSIRQVSGVQSVHLEGYPRREVQIQLDLEKMHSYQINFNQVEAILQRNNVYLPAGDIDLTTKHYNIITSGVFQDIEKLRTTFIKMEEGQFLQLQDIASVDIRYEKEQWISRYKGQESLIIYVKQDEKADVIALTKAIRQQLKKLSLSPKVRLVSVYSQADEVAAQIHTFFINLLQGLVLVAFILFLVLGIRPALMIGCFIPLSSFIGLMITNYFGLGLNQMTIVGMIVSLGLLVDNSIAIVENIERLLDEGSSIFDACVQGVNQLLYPMLSSTLTTIAVFIPIIFMPETTGAFIKPMPVVVVFTMIASLLVAITLAPVLCYFYLHRKDKKPLAKWLHWLNEQYHRWLVQAIEHTKTSMAVMLACFLLALLIFPLVGVTFFPKSDKKYFYITVETAKGTNLQHTNQIVASIEQNLSQMEEILAYTTSVGHGNPAIYYNVGFHPYAHNFGEIFVETKLDNKKQFNQFVQQVRSKLNQITEAKINVKEYSQGLPAQYPLEIIVLGDNFDELKQINQSIVRIMRQQESIININNSIESKTINLLFAIDYLKAAQLGVPEKAIEKAIKNIFEGSTIGRFTSDDNEQLAIKLRYQFNPQESLEAIQKIRLSNQQGEEIALDQLVKMELNNSINQLEHLNYDRMASVSADLVDAKHFDSVVEQLRTALDALPWKNGYTYAFKGDFENRNASFGSLGYASLVALMLILMILIAQYKSFLIPLIILAILPLSITGATFALYLTGQSFSFSAFIGLISLMGICINDSIILVDFSKTLFHQGYTGREAALQAARIRFIPVLMTSVTTILGLIFLALNGGSLWMPMAITIIGGLMGTTFFVLFLIPILFVQMSRFIEKDLDRDIVLTN